MLGSVSEMPSIAVPEWLATPARPTSPAWLAGVDVVVAGSVTSQDAPLQDTSETAGEAVMQQVPAGQIGIPYCPVGLSADEFAGVLQHLRAHKDDWAGAWTPLGDAYAQRAEAEVDNDREWAIADYLTACMCYSLARYPAPATPQQRAAMARVYDCCRAVERLVEPPAQTLMVPFGMKNMTGYLRLPTNASNAPLLVHLAGLDGYKESHAMTESLHYAQCGVAVLDLDAPGTSQGALPLMGAWRSVVKMVDTVSAMPGVDGSRVVLAGSGWGGYWATLAAMHAPERFAGVMVRMPCDGTPFELKGWSDTAAAREFLLELEAVGKPAFSVRDAPLPTGPVPQTIVGNCERDTMFPIAEVLRALRGEAEPARTDETATEDGRWHHGRIVADVFEPWIRARLGL